MKNYSIVQKILSCILKVLVAVAAVVGTFLSAYAGRNSFMGGRTVYMYFTIQSNIAIAIISIIGIWYLIKDKVGPVWSVVKFVGTVSITLTGAVFCFVLAPTMGKYAWNFQNVLTHVVVPIAAVIDYFVTGISCQVQKKNVIFVIIPPCLYAIYAGIGYVLNWQFAEGINYPYFFLNWGSEAGAFGFVKGLPFMGCAWWIIMLFVMLLVVGFVYLIIIDLLKRFVKK